MGSLPTPSFVSPFSPNTSRKPPDLNIRNILLGSTLFRPWYHSYYPEEIVGKECDRLHICPQCFKYTQHPDLFQIHLRVCQERSKDVPGDLIYSKDLHAIYEVDGAEHQLFAQNLSLFAKLFLDNKSVFFDVASFNYYLLIHIHQGSCKAFEIIGFFSKEKMSWDNNNLACILIFPPWQRKGLGKILMGVSYELCKRENKPGGPEKPLSELGRKGYLQFWQARVARSILSIQGRHLLSVDEIAKTCWVCPEDVVAALKAMGVLSGKTKAGGVRVSKRAVREWTIGRGLDLTPPIDENAFCGWWAEEVKDKA